MLNTSNFVHTLGVQTMPSVVTAITYGQTLSAERWDSAGLSGAAPGTNSITSINGLALGGAAAGNYTLTGASGSVIITPAIPAIVLTSSQNPSLCNTSVSFTATLPAYATGTVQFLTNGVAFDMETLIDGTAGSVVTTLLPVGTSTITAAYSGDRTIWPARTASTKWCLSLHSST